MKTTDVRYIKTKIYQQAMKGNISVTTDNGRVFNVKSHAGTLLVKHSDGKWVSVESVEVTS